MTQAMLDLTDTEVVLGAEIARQIFPPYLAAWIEAALREPHSLPTLVEHKRRLLFDLVAMREERSNRS